MLKLQFFIINVDYQSNCAAQLFFCANNYLFFSTLMNRKFRRIAFIWNFSSVTFDHFIILFLKKNISFKNLMTGSVKVCIIFASHTLNTIVLNVFPHWPTLIINNVSLKCSSVNVTENYFYIYFYIVYLTQYHLCSQMSTWQSIPIKVNRFA